MLEKLFGSNARAKILQLFFLRPFDKYYIRQISRDLDLQLNSVRRELDNLEKLGLLTSEHSKEPLEDNLLNEVEEPDKSINEEVIQASNDNAETPLETINEEAEVISSEGDLVDVVAEIKPKTKRSSLIVDKKYYQANRSFVLFEELKSLIAKAQILYEKDFTEKLKNLGKIDLLVLTGSFVNRTDVPVDLLIVGDFDREQFEQVIKELESEMMQEVNYSIMETQEFKYRRELMDVFLYDILGGEKIMVVNELEVN